MKACSATLWVIHILIFSSVSLFAESPNEFFPKEYVSQQKHKVQKKQSKVNSFAVDSEMHIKEQTVDVADTLFHADSPLKPPDSILLDDEGIPVHSIGLIINATEENHFRRNIEVLIETASKFELLVSQVAAIGFGIPGAKSVSVGDVIYSPHAFALVALEGQIAPYAVLPPKLDHLKRSPTWVVNTSQGGYLIEGYEPIWRLFNKRGEFIGNGDIADIFSRQKELGADRIPTESEETKDGRRVNDSILHYTSESVSNLFEEKSQER